MTDTRDCLRCKGTKIYVMEAFRYVDQTTGREVHHPRNERPCVHCRGVGTFAPPDVPAILAAIRGRKGLRSARPAGDREYYTWRMARFHGGADVTMPMNAMMSVTGDPFIKELDALADAAAKQVFGTDLAAAHRWGRALGHLDRDQPGLPASAYPSGPVADEDKPIEEHQELL